MSPSGWARRCPTTDLSDLPVLDFASAPTLNGAEGRKCGRHLWRDDLTGPGGEVECIRCGRPRDAAKSRRGRTNASRGKRIQRQRIEGLGGLNLAGNNENLDGIGTMFRYESKSGGAFPERAWRWLTGIPVAAGQIPVLIITDAPGPGHRARSVVIVDYDDWRDLHGETTND